jgi:16S rRNA (guanine527-N7)-methyltransferase
MSRDVAPVLSAQLRAQSLVLSDDQVALMARWVELLLEHNRRTNLVGTTTVDRACDELVVDSLQALPLLQAWPAGAGARAVDIGSGAGVPGIPLAIALPQLRWHLVEPRLKRAEFMDHCRRTLPLANVTVSRDHMEDLSAGWDLSVSRAVFAPDAWCESGLGLVRSGGAVLVWTNGRDWRPAQGRAVGSRSYRLADGRERSVHLVTGA